ncbi:hypothetical protein [Dyadobacter psychrophilus]|uniref:BRCT domain-containing protein n=1 Tax=Dyadobacter psychrophilus TaxID=651661 RepID=A0A1T5HFY2_9BACT|nr:hypothetical protein [Dyadobacter psychrophilus]SKC19623.1 hypothetical protein SAMN05660293_05500 [Dyadobacter psychrophilus]
MSISTSPPKKKVSEQQIEAVVNKGGKTTVESKSESADLNSTKSIKLIMTVDEMEKIKELRDKRPARSRSRKISISVHDWVIEAVQEKIERERRKYSVQ